MKKSLLLIFLSLLCSLGSIAQSYTVKGGVVDTLASNRLSHASVTLIRAADSILETFTRTTENGSFELHPDSAGKYVLMITFPGFADYIELVEVKNNYPIDLGDIAMISRAHLLEEFVLTEQVAAIKIKGDTTEYMADSFAVREGATVEELLKKLPGLQVNKDGSVVAQGEKVQKILVDGEEFFTDDPAVVTKSLQSKAVERVQVFDKKSEQAEFTGIDDGERIKTINLKLKDNMKRGYFGKIEAGGGAGDDRTYFENQAMLNAFKNKRKLSAFGIMSNTGKIGLGWEDRDKFTGGGGMTEITESGDMVTYYGGGGDEFESWSGSYNGKGFPKAWTGGLHYSNKWNEDKHHMSGNYRYAKRDVETIENTLTQNLLPGSQYFTEETNSNFNTGQRHKADVLYEMKIDSNSSIRFTADAGFMEMQNNTQFDAVTRDSAGRLMNTNDRLVTNDAVTQRVNANLIYRKKFDKKGRSLFLNLTERYSETESNGFLISTNKYYENGTIDSTGAIDQRKLNDNSNLSLSGYVNYTEPLYKENIFLAVNYGVDVNNSNADRRTLNKNQYSDYSDFDSTFSSNYRFNVLTNAGGASLRFNYEKVSFSVGGKVSNAQFTQEDLIRDTTFNYDFTNFFPQAYFRYNLAKQTSVSFHYNGRTNQPSLQQLQPLRENTDPLNIFVGNPSLTQEFRHSFRLNFNDYKMLSGRYIWAGASFNVVDNAISRTELVDSRGVRTYQYTNVDGNYNAWSYISFGKQIREWNSRLGISANVNLSHQITYINGVKNISDYNSYTGGPEWNYDSKNEKLSINFEPKVSYNSNNSTISRLATSFWSTETSLDISYLFPLEIEIESEVEWFVREQTQVFDRNNNVFRWNASISKKMLKNNQLEIKASVFDILNQNLGFTRLAQNNYITENNYNTIRRYGMLSVIWNFTKTAAGGAPEAEGGTMIIGQ